MLILAITTVWCAGFGLQKALAASVVPSGWSFSQLRERARSLAQEEYRPATQPEIPASLKRWNYEDYHQVGFRPEFAPWRGETRLEVHPMHRGYIFPDAVQIHLVEKGQAQRLHFSSQKFHYGQVPQSGELPGDFGFAGFKVYWKRESQSIEVASFVGASYFRLVGMGQQYGSSARALAVDTAVSRPEEFPRFTEFWIEKPAPEADFLQIFALLDGPSASGAYRFLLKPGSDTVAEIEGSFFARDPGRKFGIAPLTSMFLMGENRTRFVPDFRPEVHDCDGLLIRGADGLTIWRPLQNPEKKHQVSRFTVQNLEGFGLLQRDRSFQNYEDLQARYDLRPGFWVKPLSTWGPGLVELVEIPTTTEYNDNIVAYWIPDVKPARGQEFRYTYVLSASRSEPHLPPLLRVLATRVTPVVDKAPARLIVDFSGDTGEALANAQVRAHVEPADSDVRSVFLLRNDVTGGWRVTMELPAGRAMPDEFRLTLRQNEKAISETWTFRYP